MSKLSGDKPPDPHSRGGEGKEFGRKRMEGKRGGESRTGEGMGWEGKGERKGKHPPK
jgi:hypothetical protein